MANRNLRPGIPYRHTPAPNADSRVDPRQDQNLHATRSSSQLLLPDQLSQSHQLLWPRAQTLFPPLRSAFGAFTESIVGISANVPLPESFLDPLGISILGEANGRLPSIRGNYDLHLPSPPSRLDTTRPPPRALPPQPLHRLGSEKAFALLPLPCPTIVSASTTLLTSSAVLKLPLRLPPPSPSTSTIRYPSTAPGQSGPTRSRAFLSQAQRHPLPSTSLLCQLAACPPPPPPKTSPAPSPSACSSSNPRPKREEFVPFY